MRFDGDDDRGGRPYHPTDLERRRRAAEGEWAQQRALGRLCCPLAAVPGAGHSHDCPNHELTSCPTCQEEEAMKQQPTGGEWRWACDSYGKVQHSQKYDCVYSNVTGAGGTRLVRVASRVENTADARLMAAAPDLLQAVYFAVSCLDGGDKFSIHERDRFMDLARAAIRKAKEE